MKCKKRLNFISALSLLIFLNINNSYGGVTGKIVGVVSDKTTAEPLPGVNIVLENTIMGAETDLEGYYLVLNVPPGKYSLSAQMIGYNTVISQNVSVMSDLTTTINFELESTILESAEDIVVTAERPLIQKDMTAQMSVVTSDEIETMPVENIREVLSILPGFTDPYHLRGGRSNEIAYMIDGIYLNDPLYNTFDDLLIDKEIVEELMVMSGTFNAEYGNVMSGVVNVITKDPTPDFQGRLEYLSPLINESPYRNYHLENGQKINNGTGVADSPPQGLKYEPQDLGNIFPTWDQEKFRGQFRGSLSGAVPLFKGLTFFLSGRYLNENSFLPFGYDLQREIMGKLLYKLTPSTMLKFLVRRTQNNYQQYNHLYKYRPDHSSALKRDTDLAIFSFTHTLSTNTFYTVGVSYYRQTFEQKVAWKEVDIESILAVEARDTTVIPLTDYEVPVQWSVEFNYLGDEPIYREEMTSTLGGKIDFTSQINKHHQIKAGIELTKHKLDRLWFAQPWVGGIHQYQDYLIEPLEIASYIQDKIEYDFLIINIGFRFDYFDPKAMMWPFIYNPGYIDTTGNFNYYSEEKVAPKWQISPRIGMAHPVTDKMAIHFAYGHFFQRPDYRHMYYSHDITTLPYFVSAGNSDIKPQTTDQFEVGIKQQIGNDFAVDFTIYYKVINNLAGSSYQSYFPYPYAVYDNSDYASVKGLEISIRKKYSHYFSGNLNYTWQIAMGNENEAREGSALYFGDTKNALRPRQEYPLNWDRRHTFGLNFNFRTPADVGLVILGMRPFSNLGVNILAQFKSGLPYTPQVLYFPELERTMIRNSARYPWTTRIDLRAWKGFNLLGINFTVFVKINNLFDTKNVVWVYPLTGKPWDAGPTTPLSEDFQRNPSFYKAPRLIRMGLSVEW
jgi:outer membrane receptor protein involved in Fe transport